MPKKLYAWRLSDDVNSFIEQFKEKHKLKNVDDALKLIIQRLQYLEDLGLEKTKEPSLTEQLHKEEEALDWMEKNPCPYRTLVKGHKGLYEISCAERHRIRMEECMTRQKRYLQFNRKCRPIGMEKPKKAWQNKAEPKTRTWKPDDFEQAYYPDREDTFRDDWGDNF